MRRLAFCFALFLFVACASEPQRPWVVKDAISSGDMSENDALTVVGPDGGGVPLSNNNSVSEPSDSPSSTVPTQADAPIVTYDALTFDHSELVSDEPETFSSEPQAIEAMAEVPIDLEAPMVLSPRPGETLVRVDSGVSNAEVWTDGILLGPANVFLTLDPGSHELEIRANGFSPVIRQVTLTPQAQETIRVDLTPLAH